MYTMAALPTAQDVKRCDLCPDKLQKSPVEVVCKTCEIKLCSECVGKHISTKLSVKHNVVGITFRDSGLPSVPCKLHLNSRCELFCQQCGDAVCAKCLIAGTHTDHSVVELATIFTNNTHIIQHDIEELETLIKPSYEKIHAETDVKIKQLHKCYENLRKSILIQGKELHSQVDIIIKENLKQADMQEEEDLRTFRILQTDISSLLSQAQQTINEIREYLILKPEKDIIKYVSRNEEFRTVPQIMDITTPEFLPGKIKGEQLFEMFGEINPSTKVEIPEYTLQYSPSEKQILDPPCISKTIPCSIKATGVCCVSQSEEFYIRDGGTIQHLNKKGSVLNTFHTKSGRSTYIKLAVTKDKKLVYSDRADRSINIVNHGKIDTIIQLQDKTLPRRRWVPLAVCSTASDELLVCMNTDDGSRAKVVRYKQSINVQEIKNDCKGEQLYSLPHFIAENRNLQVCVTDANTKTLVVTDKDGNLLFRYDGNLSSKKYRTFSPYGVASDSMCHILVADCDNKCVHIIDHYGSFKQYIDNLDMNRPWGLSISSNDMMYIADDKKRINVIKYLK